MPANTLSWDSAQQRQLHRNDKGSRWHPVPSRKAEAHCRSNSSGRWRPGSPSGVSALLERGECRGQQGRQGQAKPLGRGCSWLTTTWAWARAAALLPAQQLDCRQAPAVFIPRQLKASSFSPSKTRKKTKIWKEKPKRKKPLLKQWPSRQQSKNHAAKGDNLLARTEFNNAHNSIPSHYF